jgi:predicted nucleic acid-binding protein
LKSLERERLAVDANPLLSAVIGGSALRVFENLRVLQFATTVHTLNEVLEYIPELAKKAKHPIGMVFLQLALLPVEVYDEQFYADMLPEAEKRIAKRDPEDIDLLALALKLDGTVWSNDRDFENIGVKQLTTAQLLSVLKL